MAFSLSDAADDSIGTADPPYSFSYKPEEPLSAFNGPDPNGQWTLEVFDGGSSAEGTLEFWSVSIRAAEYSEHQSAAHGRVRDCRPAAGLARASARRWKRGGSDPAAGGESVVTVPRAAAR